jgi:hypothetical protein
MKKYFSAILFLVMIVVSPHLVLAQWYTNSTNKTVQLSSTTDTNSVGIGAGYYNTQAILSKFHVANGALFSSTGMTAGPGFGAGSLSIAGTGSTVGLHLWKQGLTALSDATTAGNRWMLYNPNGAFSLFTGTTGDVLTATTSGNIGIGTTSPSQKLDVAGTVKMTGFNLSTSPSAGYVLKSDASGNGTWQPTTGGGKLYGTVNYLSKFIQSDSLGNSSVFENAGNVGIGTTSPAKRLELVGTSGQRIRDGVSGGNLDLWSDGTGQSHIQLGNLGKIEGQNSRFEINSIGNDLWFNTPASKNISFNINGVEKMQVNSSGNVGIGTTNPLSTLTVTSSITSPYAVLNVTNSNTATNVQTYAMKVTGGQVTNTGLNPGSYGIYVQGGSAVNSGASSYGLYVIPGSGSGANYAAYFNGNVGIGTLTPSQKLDVAGTVKMNGFNLNAAPSAGYVLTSDSIGNGSWQPSSGGSGSINGTINYLSKFTGTNSVGNSVIVENNGKIGIGTTTPDEALTFGGPGSGHAIKLDGTIFTGAVSSVGHERDFSVDPGGLTDAVHILGGVSIGNNYDGLEVQDGLIVEGNIGIGTSTPTQKLDVAGTVKMTGFNLSTSPSAGYVLTSDSIGNGMWQPLGSNGNISGTINFIPKFFSSDSISNSAIVETNGNVGIGTTNPDTFKLAVNGIIKAKEILVDTSGWADYVFEEGYALPSLEEVEKSINELKHLPGIPSKHEAGEKGIHVAEFQATLLKKIEELTLYIIQQEKKISALENLNKSIINQSGIETK